MRAPRRIFLQGSTDKALTEVIAEIGNLCLRGNEPELLHPFHPPDGHVHAAVCSPTRARVFSTS